VRQKVAKYWQDSGFEFTARENDVIGVNPFVLTNRAWLLCDFKLKNYVPRAKGNGLLREVFSASDYRLVIRFRVAKVFCLVVAVCFFKLNKMAHTRKVECVAIESLKGKPTVFFFKRVCLEKIVFVSLFHT